MNKDEETCMITMNADTKAVFRDIVMNILNNIEVREMKDLSTLRKQKILRFEIELLLHPLYYNNLLKLKEKLWME